MLVRLKTRIEWIFPLRPFTEENEKQPFFFLQRWILRYFSSASTQYRVCGSCSVTFSYAQSSWSCLSGHSCAVVCPDAVSPCGAPRLRLLAMPPQDASAPLARTSVGSWTCFSGHIFFCPLLCSLCLSLWCHNSDFKQLSYSLDNRRQQKFIRYRIVTKKTKSDTSHLS